MRFGIFATLLAGVAGLVANPLAAEPLSLEEAIRRSLASSPQGEAAAARIEILEAARAAADTKPSATIDGSVENIGTGGFGLVQVDATYNLRLERGGKRLARIELAEGDIGVAQAEALIRRLDLAKAVQELYVEAQAATLKLELARSRLEIAQRLQAEVQRRVASARDPLFAGTRARTQLAEAKVDLELADHALIAAKTRLALLTGGNPSTFSLVTTGFLGMPSLRVAANEL